MGRPSLWLVPPPNGQLYKAIHTLILKSFPMIFNQETLPPFIPHITLASGIDPDQFNDDPRKWLENLTIPESVKDMKIHLREPVVGDEFFKKVTLRCEKVSELNALVVQCRTQALGQNYDQAQQWVDETYWPHCSLMYSSLSSEDVKAKSDQIESLCSDIKANIEKATLEQGGSVMLVPTGGVPIADWTAIAERNLNGVQWSWE